MAHLIKIPGGGVAISMKDEAGANREQAIINARHEFCLKYAKEKGWGDTLESLSIMQILEICDQEKWKHPLE